MARGRSRIQNTNELPGKPHYKHFGAAYEPSSRRLIRDCARLVAMPICSLRTLETYATRVAVVERRICTNEVLTTSRSAGSSSRCCRNVQPDRSHPVTASRSGPCSALINAHNGAINYRSATKPGAQLRRNAVPERSSGVDYPVGELKLISLWVGPYLENSILRNHQWTKESNQIDNSKCMLPISTSLQ